ncbi:MAG: hypothetical protein H8D23_05970 [Candidatus Brocadiales bacterium]|nr:hypothetical protein [Candidatus Brocadiales bacterium]
MTIETVRSFLGWCSIINMGLLLYWFLFIMFAHDWVYRVHSKWFKIPVDKFDTVHYAGMMYFKLAVFVFNIVPYFALCIVD